ncbi:unnamed protein product [Orchesella dallaii]|uniref:BPTI/Kunitz inhibitor domain-containing protein n=1 Tax=Orchesella dallaii TaxID=48710 RepID=A0ABP1QSB9_9HEXA
MSGKYFIFSIRRSAAAAVYIVALLFVVGVLVSPSNGIPVASPDESASVPSTTVKILIPPSSTSDDDDDAVVIEAGNGTNSPVPREPFHPNDCSLEKSKGPCRAILDMWFFNSATKTCEQFQYSGCGGNGNRFSEKMECENLCGADSKNKSGDDDVEDDTVVIEAEESNNGTCPEFDGCGPLKCAVIKDEKTGCQKCACSLIPDDDEPEIKLPVGSVSGKPSEDDEERMNDKPEDVCGLPEVRGDCRAMVTRFRFDTKTKKCIMFHYGGCNSNGNNFVSEEKCMQFCKGQ